MSNHRPGQQEPEHEQKEEVRMSVAERRKRREAEMWFAARNKVGRPSHEVLIEKNDRNWDHTAPMSEWIPDWRIPEPKREV